MKKLMIAAAIVCAAALSQAATATWGVSNVYKSDDATTRAASGSYTGYFFIDSGATSMATISAMLAATDKTAAEKISALSGAALKESALTGSGRISTAVDFGTLADGNYKAYTVIVDGNSTTPGQNYVIGDQVDVFVTSIGDSSIGSWVATTKTQAGYSALAASAAPEPTSGLLLLLGVAGLALKRRRA